MSSPTIRTRALMLSVSAAALVAPALSQARTTTMYACVKRNGSARISKRKLRCAKHESRMSWAVRGPAGRSGPPGADGRTGADGSNGATGAPGAGGATGAPGATGASGANGKDGLNGANGVNGKDGSNGLDGTNGAVAGFATAPMTEGVTFTGASEGSPQTIVSMTLPAGNFVANGKVEARLSDSKSGGFANVECRLIDTPTGGGTAAFDTSGWSSLIDVPFLSIHVGQNTIPLTLAVSSPTSPSALSLMCWVAVKEAAGGTLTAEANNASITAVQTATNS